MYAGTWKVQQGCYLPSCAWNFERGQQHNIPSIHRIFLTKCQRSKFYHPQEGSPWLYKYSTMAWNFPSPPSSFIPWLTSITHCSNMALLSRCLMLLALSMIAGNPWARAATYTQSRAAYYPSSDESGTDGNPNTWTPFGSGYCDLSTLTISLAPVSCLKNFSISLMSSFLHFHEVLHKVGFEILEFERL